MVDRRRGSAAGREGRECNDVDAEHVWGAAELIVSFLLVLGGVVFVHEFGHFIVARRCGVKVEAFSIGMGPEVVGRTDRRGSRWRLSAIPSAASALRRRPRRGERPRRRRARGDVAGRAARDARRPAGAGARGDRRRRADLNLVAAVVVLSAVAYAYGDRFLPPRVDSVVAGSPAEQAGFNPGDVVESVNGRAIATSTTSSTSSPCGQARP